MPRPTKRSCLECLTKKRLLELDREFGLGTPQPEPKAAFVEALAASKAASFAKLLDALRLDELRHVCRAHELAVTGSKAQLAERLRGDEGGPRKEPEPAQALLLPPEEPGDAPGGVDDDLAAFFARSRPTVRGIVPGLSQSELGAVLRRLRERHGIALDLRAVDPGLGSLAAALEAVCELPVLLSELSREQLAKVCQRYALVPAGPSHDELVRTILAAAAGLTVEEASSVPHRVEAAPQPDEPPRVGDIVRARQRQYLVSDVIPPPDTQAPGSDPRPSTRVRLRCLDDDAQGAELELFWELELGARRIDPARQGLRPIDRFDPAPRFSAYYHALQWSCVTTATEPDQERVQAPFRAGIAVMQHQLVPLLKVLALPRANLFIADDVGLGKTIEAGLVLQELLLRQRLDLVLIVCPASICLQWQGEMERRFGLRFEIVDREHVAHVRRQRGHAANPWDCGRRFIVSYQTLRRPEYQEPLLLALGSRRAKSMLVLDEAHTVAPAAAQRYAVDTQLTKLARKLAPMFENRLFLSATPHNGHSNSFSALLELLDPSRFTRGVPVAGRAALDAVMVRRLKRDLRGQSTLTFPVRRLVELQVRRDGEAWTLTRAVHGEGDPGPTRPLAPAQSPELELSEILARYTELCAPSAQRDRRVFIALQKRLLSSVAAFERTLQVHLGKTGPRILARLGAEPSTGDDGPGAVSIAHEGALEDETRGVELDVELQQAVARGGSLPEDTSVRARARALQERMEELVRGAWSRPEGKLLALLEWIREHQCPAAGRQWLATPPDASRAFTATRLIVFTEYADTASYVIKMLRAALAGTDREDERIAWFHGAMSDDQRAELQADFNAPPGKHPVRILVATDAAREGVNLQAHCADLVHYDIPWNPGRLEQRNGRIDRTLQPSPEVRCMYFAYPQRREDRVLQVLVDKVETIGRELGSLSAVVLDRIEQALEPHGIDARAPERIAAAGEGDTGARAASEREMEPLREDARALARDIERAADCYARSREFFAPDAEGLRHTLGMALALGGAANEGRFEPVPPDPAAAARGEPPCFAVPAMPDDWARTLDTLRPPRPKDATWWEWRRTTPPRPVAFEPLQRLTDEVIQLHLEHPVVRRALARFTAQGYAAHDLRRATLVRYQGTHERVVVIGRLSLFGDGATRLHDGLLCLAAQVHEDGETRELTRPADREATIAWMRAALAERGDGFSPAPAFVAERLRRVDAQVSELWPRLEAQARDEAAELVRRLDDRGAREAEALREILEGQKAAILRALAEQEEPVQQDLTVTDPEARRAEDAEARQRRLDREHMKSRLHALETELGREPEQLRAHYRVVTTRIEAVGLVVLVPHTR